MPLSSLVNGQQLATCAVVWIFPQGTQSVVSESPFIAPFLAIPTTVALDCPKTVRLRPLTPEAIETRKSGTLVTGRDTQRYAY